MKDYFIGPCIYNKPGGFNKRQGEWDNYGNKVQERIKNAPESVIVHASPHEDKTWNSTLMSAIGHINNRTILELGCATGLFATYLAKEGASVVGCDIAFQAVKGASQRAEINVVSANFLQLNLAYPMSFESNSFDLVVGINVLHHLTKPDVLMTLGETFRVLREGGKAVFFEPVENSVVFEHVQNMLPSGERGSPFYRPSSFSRSAFLDYLETADDRSLTNKELVEAGNMFKAVTLTPFGLFSRMEGLFEFMGIQSNLIHHALSKFDELIFKICTPLKRYCQTVLVEYNK